MNIHFLHVAQFCTAKRPSSVSASSLVIAEVDPDTLVRESSARDVIKGECAFILNHKLSYEFVIALLLHLFQRNLCSM